jgi:hypothetical protein
MDVLPVPEVGMTRILGLLEVLDDHGGREDIYRLARDLSYEFGDLLGVIKAAEILGLVDTPGGDVVLQPLGKQIIESDVNTKKSLLKKQVKGHSLFAHFLGFSRDPAPPQKRRRRPRPVAFFIRGQESPGHKAQIQDGWASQDSHTALAPASMRGAPCATSHTAISFTRDLLPAGRRTLRLESSTQFYTPGDA